MQTQLNIDIGPARQLAAQFIGLGYRAYEMPSLEDDTQWSIAASLAGTDVPDISTRLMVVGLVAQAGRKSAAQA